MTMLRVPPNTMPPSPPFPPPCALFNEDSPMQLKILASRCYCMTNRSTVIPHGLSFLLQEAEEMEKYTRVPVAREADREDFVRVCLCVRVCEEEQPPPISTGNGKGQREKSMTKEHEEQAYKMALTAHHTLNKGFCVHPPNSGDHECFIRRLSHHHLFFSNIFVKMTE